ncbi:MAG: GntR family transcriptional regulator [Planctomycetia bacterium]|nr:GntR family transcriptional regulator [Planctomycetia bacterium]
MEHFEPTQEGAPRPASLKHRAYQHIRRQLIDGSLGEGAHLSPVELGKEIGVSHIPVREAITQLVSEGLVVQIARQGAFVRRIRRRELLELIDLRGMLEAAAVVKAARRIKPAELENLQDYLGALEALVDRFRAGRDEDMVPLMGEWMLADLAFHMLLLRVAGNRQVVKVIADKQIMIQMFRHRTDAPEAWNRPLSTYYRDNYELHRDIAEAVGRRDGAAARRAMAAHMTHARANMLARFDWLRRQKNAGDPLARDFPESMRQLVQEVQQRFIKEPPGK